MKTRKCIVCGEVYEPVSGTQKTCSEECRKERQKLREARRNKTRKKNHTQRFPKDLRDLRPKWCKATQCEVIKLAVRQCRSNRQTIREVMPLYWESQPKCLACQDKGFNEMLVLLGAGFKRGRTNAPKKKVKK